MCGHRRPPSPPSGERAACGVSGALGFKRRRGRHFLVHGRSNRWTNFPLTPDPLPRWGRGRSRSSAFASIRVIRGPFSSAAWLQSSPSYAPRCRGRTAASLRLQPHQQIFALHRLADLGVDLGHDAVGQRSSSDQKNTGGSGTRLPTLPPVAGPHGPAKCTALPDGTWVEIHPPASPSTRTAKPSSYGDTTR